MADWFYEANGRLFWVHQNDERLRPFLAAPKVRKQRRKLVLFETTLLHSLVVNSREGISFLKNSKTQKNKKDYVHGAEKKYRFKIFISQTKEVH